MSIANKVGVGVKKDSVFNQVTSPAPMTPATPNHQAPQTPATPNHQAPQTPATPDHQAPSRSRRRSSSSRQTTPTPAPLPEPKPEPKSEVVSKVREQSVAERVGLKRDDVVKRVEDQKKFSSSRGYVVKEDKAEEEVKKFVGMTDKEKQKIGITPQSELPWNKKSVPRDNRATTTTESVTVNPDTGEKTVTKTQSFKQMLGDDIIKKVDEDPRYQLSYDSVEVEPYKDGWITTKDGNLNIYRSRPKSDIEKLEDSVRERAQGLNLEPPKGVRYIPPTTDENIAFQINQLNPRGF
jgi:hypothetical protein